MKYMNLSIRKIHDAILKGEVTPLELVKEALEKAKKDDNNAFEYICEKEALDKVTSLVTVFIFRFPIRYFIKDKILIKP